MNCRGLESPAVAIFWFLLGGLAGAQTPGERIAAYGRVSPSDRPVVVAIPPYLGSPQVVAALDVKVGDRVTKGQKLAETQTAGLADADLAIAKARLDTSERRVEALNAGPKPEEIAAQEATVESLAAEARAQKAKKRPDTAAERAEAKAREEAADWKVTAGRRQLDAMRAVRPADLAVTRAEAAEAKAAVRRAEALLALTTIESPIDGEVLRILAYPGENPTGGGLLEAGATQEMVIKAELSVADAARVKAGDRATVTSDAWAGEVSGTVVRLDPRVERSALTAPSTFANVDRQIVEATIQPTADALAKFAERVGAEVTVSIVAERGAR